MGLSGSTVVIRPSPHVLARRVATGLGVAVPLLMFRLVVGSHQLGWTNAILITLATLAGIALVFAVYFRMVRVVITPEQVIVRGMTGRQRRWPREAVKGLELFSVLVTLPPTLLIVAYGADRHALFKLSGIHWDKPALRALTHELGHRPRGTAIFAEVSEEDLLERYPGALSYTDRHPYLVGGSIGFLIPFIVIAVVLAFQILVLHK